MNPFNIGNNLKKGLNQNTLSLAQGIYNLPTKVPQFKNGKDAQPPKNLKAYAKGRDKIDRNMGEIEGPGTPTSDSIPAMVSDEEAILNPGAVQALKSMFGEDVIKSLNAQYAPDGAETQMMPMMGLKAAAGFDLSTGFKESMQNSVGDIGIATGLADEILRKPEIAAQRDNAISVLKAKGGFSPDAVPYRGLNAPVDPKTVPKFKDGVDDPFKPNDTYNRDLFNQRAAKANASAAQQAESLRFRNAPPQDLGAFKPNETYAAENFKNRLNAAAPQAAQQAQMTRELYPKLTQTSLKQQAAALAPKAAEQSAAFRAVYPAQPPANPSPSLNLAGAAQNAAQQSAGLRSGGFGQGFAQSVSQPAAAPSPAVDPWTGQAPKPFSLPKLNAQGLKSAANVVKEAAKNTAADPLSWAQAADVANTALLERGLRSGNAGLTEAARVPLNLALNPTTTAAFFAGPQGEGMIPRALDAIGNKLTDAYANATATRWNHDVMKRQLTQGGNAELMGAGAVPPSGGNQPPLGGNPPAGLAAANPQAQPPSQINPLNVSDPNIYGPNGINLGPNPTTEQISQLLGQTEQPSGLDQYKQYLQAQIDAQKQADDYARKQNAIQFSRYGQVMPGAQGLDARAAFAPQELDANVKAAQATGQVAINKAMLEAEIEKYKADQPVYDVRMDAYGNPYEFQRSGKGAGNKQQYDFSDDDFAQPAMQALGKAAYDYAKANPDEETSPRIAALLQAYLGYNKRNQ
jgi:hypothetical protein